MKIWMRSVLFYAEKVNQYLKIRKKKSTEPVFARLHSQKTQ